MLEAVELGIRLEEIGFFYSIGGLFWYKIGIIRWDGNTWAKDF